MALVSTTAGMLSKMRSFNVLERIDRRRAQDSAARAALQPGHPPGSTFGNQRQIVPRLSGAAFDNLQCLTQTAATTSGTSFANDGSGDGLGEPRQIFQPAVERMPRAGQLADPQVAFDRNATVPRRTSILGQLTPETLGSAPNGIEHARPASGAADAEGVREQHRALCIAEQHVDARTGNSHTEEVRGDAFELVGLVEDDSSRSLG